MMVINQSWTHLFLLQSKIFLSKPSHPLMTIAQSRLNFAFAMGPSATLAQSRSLSLKFLVG